MSRKPAASGMATVPAEYTSTLAMTIVLRDIRSSR
jgi:hypothetical protein